MGPVSVKCTCFGREKISMDDRHIFVCTKAVDPSVKVAPEQGLEPWTVRLKA